MMGERCKIALAMAITGLAKRQLQMLAAQGKVPGAAKLGGTWTFNERVLRQWVAKREAEACQTISIAVDASGGQGSRCGDGTLDEAYERLLASRRASV